jgi:hypothetical protein
MPSSTITQTDDATTRIMQSTITASMLVQRKGKFHEQQDSCIIQSVQSPLHCIYTSLIFNNCYLGVWVYHLGIPARKCAKDLGLTQTAMRAESAGRKRQDEKDDDEGPKDVAQVQLAQRAAGMHAVSTSAADEGASIRHHSTAKTT